MADTQLHTHLLTLIIWFCSLLVTTSVSNVQDSWPNHGGDLQNRRYANRETKISPSTVSGLRLRWQFYAGGDISVTPAIYDGAVYFPSWNGFLYAVRASNGALLWKKNLQKLTGFNNTGFVLNVNSTVSRSTPTVAGELLLVGIYGPAVVIAVKRSTGKLVWSTRLDYNNRSFITMSGTHYKGSGFNNTGFVLNVNSTVSRSTPTVAGELLLAGIYGPAVVIAVKRSTGKLVWSTRLDYNNRSFITMSGTHYKGSFFIGTSSLEEGLPLEQCCTFRGSFSKLNARTGAILWQTFMLPNNHDDIDEYAGAAIWGSSPAIDPGRNLIYIATGNLYSAPLRIRECQERENNRTEPTQPDKCIEPENHANSILALDVDSGDIKWYKQLGGYDVWFGACNWHLDPRCPPGPSHDADFGEAPMILSVFVSKMKRDIVVAVQKSGYAWALDRDNGTLVWFKEAGPGGLGGGGMWGAATDEKRVYTNIANSQHKNFTLKPTNTTTIAGGWVAMEAKSGNILWSTVNLNDATAPGPVTVANGVVFAGSTYRQGPIYAMDAKTGKILWSNDTGATVYGGISVNNGCIYLGNGYKEHIGFVNKNYTAGTSLYAFCV